MRQTEVAESAYSVRAAVRVLDILDVLQQAPGVVSLGVVAEAAGLPKSTAFRYLSTLEARGYVEREHAGGDYRLGLAFLPSHTRHLENLAARVRPILEELRDRIQETVNFGVLDGHRVAYLEIAESPKAMRMAARKGDRDPIHSTALGKAIAATLAEEDLRSILTSEGMPQLTARTLTDVDEFVEAVEEVQRRGYAVDDRENEEDGRCVAVPVRSVRVPAAISLSAPATRLEMDAVEGVAHALRDAASRIAPEARGADA